MRLRGTAAFSTLLLLPGPLLAQTRTVSEEKLARYARDACGTRWMIRRQAARRLLKAGRRGFLALRSHVRKQGRGVLTVEAVQVIPDFGLAEGRPWLTGLAKDRSFAWRPQALEALARFAHPGDREVFRAFLGSPSSLLRMAALQGMDALGGEEGRKALETSLQDPELRVQVRAAGLLLDRKDLRGLPVLVTALRAEEDFFGRDLGLPVRMKALEKLRSWAGGDQGYKATLPRGKREAGAAAFEALARKALGEAHVPRKLPEAADRSWILGFERRSCRDGDLILRVDAEGRLWKGLFRPKLLRRLEKEEIEGLERGAGERARPGTVQCDFLRFGDRAGSSARYPPGSLGAGLRALQARWEGLVRR